MESVAEFVQIAYIVLKQILHRIFLIAFAAVPTAQRISASSELKLTQGEAMKALRDCQSCSADHDIGADYLVVHAVLRNRSAEGFTGKMQGI